MALECNIDARGKAYRIKLGITTTIFGLILTILTYFNFPSILWNNLPEVATTLGLFICVCIIIGGLFAIWEGRKGWCVVRAMGFKTRI
mgnify:CR=1 FL=1|tara:strand:+ start:921 stop:1184 length:264 start_codon:yes stop_codon:yes gene_type:complete